MEYEILEQIKAYLGSDYISAEESKYLAIINRAIARFKAFRRYPKDYTSDMVDNDLEYYMSCLFDLSLYWIVKEGAEFESFHIENSVQRAFNSESAIFQSHCISPIAKLI